jgi:hypothetical protein
MAVWRAQRQASAGSQSSLPGRQPDGLPRVAVATAVLVGEAGRRHRMLAVFDLSPFHHREILPAAKAGTQSGPFRQEYLLPLVSGIATTRYPLLKMPFSSPNSAQSREIAKGRAR